jgi:hypothetical protein
MDIGVPVHPLLVDNPMQVVAGIGTIAEEEGLPLLTSGRTGDPPRNYPNQGSQFALTI